MKYSKKKVILAYSGGLDTSVITKWLVMKGYNVICVCVDLGQKVENINDIKKKGIKSGASKVYIIDAKEEFVRDYVFEGISWNAKYEGEYLLGTSYARPLISKILVDIANKENAEFISHGATGKGNDQVRFELSIYALDPKIKIIAPWRKEEFIKQFPGRKELLKFAEENNIPVKATKNEPWSTDENMMHISFEAGMLEDPQVKPLDSMFEISVSPQNAPDKVIELKITFEKGNAVAINGKHETPAKILEKLNNYGAKNGIGRVDMVENRFVGMKSRGVYETPGGTILLKAHRAMESLTLDRDLGHLKDMLMPIFSEMVYNGFWFSPKAKAMRKFLKESQKNINGIIRLELYKGNITITGRISENSLYDEKIASMDDDGGVYNHQDAEGFIKLNSLPLRVQASKIKIFGNK